MSRPITFLVPDHQTVRVRAPHHSEGCSLVAPHWPYRAAHLLAVEEEMVRRGGPVIRAHWDGENWRAIEGAHRIATAGRTRHVIRIEEVGLEDEFDHDQPSVGRITVERMLRERIYGSDAFYELEPWPPARPAVILGGALSLHEDLEQLAELVDIDSCVVIAINDAGRDYRGRIDHWMTLHANRLPAWIRLRALRCGLDPQEHLRRRPYVVWSNEAHHLVDRVRSDWGGSSGLFAPKNVIEDLQLPRGILTGVPIDPQRHFDRDGDWLAAEAMQPIWLSRMPQLQGRFRSMSGWTMEQLGRPTREWIQEGFA